MRKVLSVLFAVSIFGHAIAQNPAPNEKKDNEGSSHTKKIIHKIDKTETININTNVRPELMSSKQDFCGTSKADCKKQCNAWLKEQKKNLKGSVRTSHCSNGRDLYGKEENGCMNVTCSGEITYVLK